MSRAQESMPDVWLTSDSDRDRAARTKPWERERRWFFYNQRNQKGSSRCFKKLNQEVDPTNQCCALCADIQTDRIENCPQPKVLKSNFCQYHQKCNNLKSYDTLKGQLKQAGYPIHNAMFEKDGLALNSPLKYGSYIYKDRNGKQRRIILSPDQAHAKWATDTGNKLFRNQKKKPKKTSKIYQKIRDYKRFKT